MLEAIAFTFLQAYFHKLHNPYTFHRLKAWSSERETLVHLQDAYDLVLACCHIDETKIMLSQQLFKWRWNSHFLERSGRMFFDFIWYQMEVFLLVDRHIFTACFCCSIAKY